eukprot:2635008-Pleurochrysis_carterae.AAC.1
MARSCHRIASHDAAAREAERFVRAGKGPPHILTHCDATHSRLAACAGVVAWPAHVALNAHELRNASALRARRDPHASPLRGVSPLAI